jgi:hypothetical protein
MDHSRRANRDPLALPFEGLGFPAPVCGCEKTAGSSTRRLPTIVQQDTACEASWRDDGESGFHMRAANREQFLLHLARTAGLKRERCLAAGSITVVTTLTSWKRCDRAPRVKLQDRSAPETMQEPAQRPRNRAAQSAARLLESSTLPPSALPESRATA